MYMQGIDFTFYWLTGEKTHLYLGCWENKRSKKLVNGVLPVCLLSYFVGKPKESAAWWALGIQRFINHWSRKCFCKGPVIICRLGGGGVMGLVGWYFGPLPLNDVLLKWSSSSLLINSWFSPKFSPPKKKIIINDGKKEGKQEESPKNNAGRSNSRHISSCET